MSVKTTAQFKRLPIGKVCMVYFHAIDVVLGRKELVRRAWQARCYLPRAMFSSKKGRKSARVAKLQNYACFKRMLGVKRAVYDRHKTMLRLYEKYCEEAEIEKYWGDDDDQSLEDIAPAAHVSEDDCDEGF